MPVRGRIPVVCYNCCVQPEHDAPFPSSSAEAHFEYKPFASYRRIRTIHVRVRSAERAWIESCARYLSTVFGERIVGSTVLDYAFGRGNWSLAALRAGAARVVAVDASQTNVLRFRALCREEGIDQIEIIEGNILEEPIDCSADILWKYGILHHIEQPSLFLQRIAGCRRDRRASALLYAYDAGSLRHAVVTQARRGIVYESEQAFIDDSLLFTPKARLRARDDLTAPHIDWFDRARLVSLIEGAGMRTLGKVPDFPEWLQGRASEEFRPHLLLCGFDEPPGPLPTEPARECQHDVEVIAELAGTVMSELQPDQRKKAAIGLTNTHFSAVSRDMPVDAAILEDFLYLAHCVLRFGIPAHRLRAAFPHYEAALSALNGSARYLEPELLAISPLARFLQANAIRL